MLQQDGTELHKYYSVQHNMVRQSICGQLDVSLDSL